MTVAERGNRRGVRETDQPGFVDHPDRLGDTLKYRRREALVGQRRRLADTIGRSSSLNDPQAGNLLNPGSDSTTACLAEPGMKRRQLRHQFDLEERALIIVDDPGGPRPAGEAPGAGARHDVAEPGAGIGLEPAVLHGHGALLSAVRRPV